MKRLCTTSVMDRLDIASKTTVRKYVKNGLLPKPLQDPGSNINYWLESDIDQLIQRQAERRDGKVSEQKQAVA